MPPMARGDHPDDGRVEDLLLAEEAHGTPDVARHEGQRGHVEVAPVVRSQEHRAASRARAPRRRCRTARRGTTACGRTGGACGTAPSPTTLGTPGGRSQCSTGQRRAVATTVSEGSGLTACGEPDARQQRHVEDAVAAGVAVGQVDAVLIGPCPHRAQLPRPPDEALVETARVPAVLGLVGGGDQVVEADGLGEGGDHVGRCRRGEHQPVALGPEGGQALRGEGGDDLAQLRTPPAGRPPGPAPGASRWATRAAARTRPMENRFSPRRSLTAYRILSPGSERPSGSTPSSTRARFRIWPDARHSRVRSRSMKTALFATGREPKAVRSLVGGLRSASRNRARIRRRDRRGGGRSLLETHQGQRGGFRFPAVWHLFWRHLGNQSSSFGRYFRSVIVIESDNSGKHLSEETGPWN